MFKKRHARNLREKKSSDDEDENNTRASSESRGSSSNVSAPFFSNKKTTAATVNLEEDEIIPDTSTTTIKHAATASSLLSFGDEAAELDEGGEFFQTAKSSSSSRRNGGGGDRRARRAAKSAKSSTTKNAAEKLDGGKGGLHFSSSSKKRQETEDVIIVKEKKLEKREESSPPIILPNIHQQNDDDDDDDETEPPVIGKFKQMLTSGAIPDANLIHMARKQRQMAREMGGGGGTSDDYVPFIKKKLGDDDDTKKYKKTNHASRLIREDDDIDEDDDENGGGGDSGEEGGKFYSKLHDEDEEERRRVEADFLRVEQGDSEEEKDDELDRWEREQIRKGVSTNQMSYFAQEYMTAAASYGDPRHYFDNSKHHHQPQQMIDLTKEAEEDEEIKEPQPMDLEMDLAHEDEESSTINQQKQQFPKTAGAGRFDSQSAAVPTFESVTSKLEQRLEEQRSVHRARLLDLEKIRGSLTENESSAANLNELAPRLSDQYRFYQEMRTYVRDLLECFNEKVPLIESVSTRIMDLWTGRASFLAKRRQQDTKDQYDDCSAAASLGKTQLIQQQQQQQPDSDRMMRVAEREARRTRRRQAREKTLSSLGHHEGTSSDDEEAPSKVVAFKNEKEKLSSEAAEIFKDTEEEFYSLESITGRFLDWRDVYRKSFDQAYILYCLPKLLAPLVKWRTLMWTPLDSDSAPLRTMDWYISCDKISRSITADDNDHDDDGPTNEEEKKDYYDFIYSLLDVAVLPKVKDIVENVWDPTSSSQSSNLIGFVSSLQRDHPKSSAKGKHFAELKEAIKNRVKRCFDDDLFTPIYSKEVLQNKASGASVFLDRQFWFNIKVVQNVCSWTSVFSDTEVQELVFDGVVNRHVVLALQCGGQLDTTTLTKCKAICNALPSSWFATVADSKKNGSGGDPTTLPQLQPFCKFLIRMADEFNGSKSRIMEKTTIRESTKEIYNLLKNTLNAGMYADMVSKKYRVK